MGFAHQTTRGTSAELRANTPSKGLGVINRLRFEPVFSLLRRMKQLWALALATITGVVGAGQIPLPVLKRSDVVFMYEAGRDAYQAYGGTVLAWGGKPTEESLRNAEGLKFFGSVGMVTEFQRYYDRFPDKYEEGLCRNLEGKPYKVPWLVDHQHKGIPYWWCCTRQPLFRQYLTERVLETVKAGAYGVHIDDHLGTAGSLWLGGCFCERCAREFREDLKRLAPEGINPATYDYPRELRSWLKEHPGRKVEEHPLWQRWRAYQLKGAAAFMSELRALAARAANRAVPISANAGLLWGPHLNDYVSLDFFSAEVGHHASTLKFSYDPIIAYRIADAVNRPLASTASGGDWAFIKEKNLPGLVQGWIALGYASGHSLMAPNRQWCHTPEKGTHWYDGPKEKYAPLYRFVREHADWFDEYRPYSDVTVAYSQRTFDRVPGKLTEICRQLSARNIAYDLALGGDEVVNHPLSTAEFRRARRVVVIEQDDFGKADQELLGSLKLIGKLLPSAEATQITPAVRVEGEARVLLLPRTKSDSAVIHVLNWTYDAGRDAVQPVKDLRLKIDFAALGMPSASGAKAITPGREPLNLRRDGDGLVLPEAGLWTVLRLEP